LPGEGAKREGNDVISTRFGLAEEAGRMIKVIAITGAFIPRRNNVVIGRVTDITFHGWLIDIDSASSGFLPVEESPRFINKSEMDQFLEDPPAWIAARWGGGKFKMNLHHGLHFVSTKNFKPVGAPRWQEAPELPTEKPIV